MTYASKEFKKGFNIKAGETSRYDRAHPLHNDSLPLATGSCQLSVQNLAPPLFARILGSLVAQAVVLWSAPGVQVP
jgi:hypothetical protein